MKATTRATAFRHPWVRRQPAARPVVSGPACAALWLVALCAAALASPDPVVLRTPKDNAICLGCHSIPGKQKTLPGGEVVPLTVSEQQLRDSVHANLTCTDCHRDVAALPHRAPLKAVRCERCHYVSPLQTTPAAGKPPPYRSPHAAARLRGDPKAPRCADCHGRHDVQPVSDPKGRLGRRQMADTCGACHPRVAREYRESIHGQALRKGNPDVPVCADCHPEHARAASSGLPGLMAGGVVATCVACHEDPGLQRRYAIPSHRLASYLGSYHGAATELGDNRVANCASCHGAHAILPSSDPRSTVSRARLQETCGRCHPRAGVHFAEGRVHLQPSPRQDRAVFWVRVAYQTFIAGLMLAFLGYIALDLLTRLRNYLRTRERAHRAPPDEPQFERLSLTQRVQHWLLVLSFTALIVTGFPLVFPQSGISQGVVTLLGGTGVRAVVHRAAALLLIALVVFHFHYVVVSARGRWEFLQLLPQPQDAKDLLRMLGVYFGLGRTRPRFGRYNYIEKFEYLAVGWGSAVMIASGILLWSPGVTLAYLPKWVMDVALVVHSWEAVLAFLAIIVWHMYNVHWNPSVFPMSRIWLTGKIGLNELRENHPLEYERIVPGASAEAQEEGGARAPNEPPPR